MASATATVAAANAMSTAGLSVAELRAAGWVQEPGRPDSWLPPSDAPLVPPIDDDEQAATSPSVPNDAEAELAPVPSGNDESHDESHEVDELERMLSRTSPAHGASKRQPSAALTAARLRAQARPKDLGMPRSELKPRRLAAEKKHDIGPGWDFTPHRNRPSVLRGLNTVTNEPWKRAEDLNYGRDAHIEWRTTHKNLLGRSSAAPVETLDEVEAEALRKSELMGNRLLQEQTKQAKARRRAKAAAVRARRRAEEEARAAEMEARRSEVEAELRRAAHAEDAELVAELARRRREAEAEAKEEARRRAEEEKLREEAEAKAKEEAAAARAAKARKDEEAEKKAKAKAAAAAAAAKGKAAAAAPAEKARGKEAAKEAKDAKRLRNKNAGRGAA